MVNPALPLACLLCLVSSPLWAAGGVDSSFNPVVNGVIHALALTPDGKVLIGGEYSVAGTGHRSGISRLMAANGSPDPAWMPDSGKAVTSCVVLGNGQVIAGAWFPKHEGICRLLPDGTSDPSFTARVGEGQIRSMALDADENLLLTGDFLTINGLSRRGFAAMSSDGALLDRYPLSLPAGRSVFALAPRSNRTLVLGGNFGALNQQDYSRLARFTANGGLDPEFRPQLPEAAGNEVTCLAIQADGSVIVGGNFNRVVEGVTELSCLKRILPNGSVDVSFKPAFTRGVEVPRITSIVLQGDGKILIAGDFTAVNGLEAQGVVRLLPNGTLDRSLAVSAAGASGLAIQADGKIIVTGSLTKIGTTTRGLIARLHNESVKEVMQVSKDRIVWMRDGALPESDLVSLEVFPDGGTTWQPLPRGRRNGSIWYVEQLDLPDSGIIRGRARYASGYMNASSSLVEKKVSYVLKPEIAVLERTPAGLVSLTDGASQPLDFGESPQGSPQVRTLEISSSGSGNLTMTGITLPQGFRLVEPPVFPVVLRPGSRFVVNLQADAVAPGSFGGTARIESDDADEAEFDISLASVVTGPDISLHLENSELQSGQSGWVYVGETIQGSVPSPKNFVVRNQGNRELAVTGATASTGFFVEPFEPFVLQPGEERALSVGPDQRITGSITGELQVLSSDPDEAVFRVPLEARVRNPLTARILKFRTKVDRKAGLRSQTIRISNPTTEATVPGFRVILRGLPDWLQVRNASEVLPDGSVVIEVRQPLAPGASFDLVVKYELPKRKMVVSPQVSVEVLFDDAQAVAQASRVVLPVSSLAVEKCERTAEGHFAITFHSVPGRSYQVEYSADGIEWKICPPIRAAGNKVRWLDSGAPHTDRAPSEVARRFYRVRELDE